MGSNQERAREVVQEIPGFGSLRASEQDACVRQITALLEERDREHESELRWLEETTRGERELALAARVVEVEVALASEEWRDRIIRECVRYDNEQHAGNYGMGGGTPGDGASIVFDEIDSLLSSPSPAVEAVREVLRYGLAAEIRYRALLREGQEGGEGR